jgi:multidrug efflux pump subunit AcrA (membrane-fusion protein)
VRTIIPTADRQKATVKVRIAFDELDPRILPDMGVKVAFLAEQKPGESVPAHAVVPADAVRTGGGQSVVFVVRDSRLERRAVSLGNVGADEVQVVAGLAPGELVVVKGPEGLRDGRRVKVKS